jgi:hypothetical protein
MGSVRVDWERSGSPRVIRFIKHWSPAMGRDRGMQSSMIWICGAKACRILRRERRMLTAALEAKVGAYLAELAGERDGRGIRVTC